MAAKKSKKNFKPLIDVKWGVYSFLQGCIVLSTFFLTYKLITFKVDTSSVSDFLAKSEHDLKSSIHHTASIISNLVQVVYSLPQLDSSNPIVDNSSVADLTEPGISLNVNTNFEAKYVHDYSFQSHFGSCSFACSDVVGIFKVGDLWLDGGIIEKITDKGFFTSSSVYFALPSSPKKFLSNSDTKINDLRINNDYRINKNG